MKEDAARKQPWMKFFTSDWRSEETLRTCSLAARGLWMELLCIMSEADPRGSLVRDGKPYSIRQIANLAGCAEKVAGALLTELEEQSVFSRDEDGTIYSRRMRRDVEKASRDKQNGNTGGNPNLKPPDNGGVNPPDKAQKLEARSQKPEEFSLRENPTRVAVETFDRAWGIYPRRDGHNPKKPARDKLIRLVLAGEDPEKIIAGIEAYARSRRDEPPQFTKQMVVFLNQRGWEDDHKRRARAGPPSFEDGRTILKRQLGEIIDDERSQNHPSQSNASAPSDVSSRPLSDEVHQRRREDHGEPLRNLEQAGPYAR